jgi:hypothetical protein
MTFTKFTLPKTKEDTRKMPLGEFIELRTMAENTWLQEKLVPENVLQVLRWGYEITHEVLAEGDEL